MAVPVAPSNWSKEIAKLSSAINATEYFVLLKLYYFIAFLHSLASSFFYVGSKEMTFLGSKKEKKLSFFK